MAHAVPMTPTTPDLAAQVRSLAVKGAFIPLTVEDCKVLFAAGAALDTLKEDQ
jgi:hypothetical protein